MAEPKFRPPPERRTVPLPKGDAPQFQFTILKEKPKSGKQLFREKLVSDEGMAALYHKVHKDPSLFKNKDPVVDLKKILWHTRDWQHGLFPRMKFDSFISYTSLIKTYRYDIEQTMAKVNGAAVPQEVAAEEIPAPTSSAKPPLGGEDFDEYECEDDPEDQPFYPAAQMAKEVEPAASQITYFQPKSRQEPTQPTSTPPPVLIAEEDSPIHELGDANHKRCLEGEPDDAMVNSKRQKTPDASEDLLVDTF